jgi:hypothetical protein
MLKIQSFSGLQCLCCCFSYWSAIKVFFTYDKYKRRSEGWGNSGCGAWNPDIQSYFSGLLSCDKLHTTIWSLWYVISGNKAWAGFRKSVFSWLSCFCSSRVTNFRRRSDGVRNCYAMESEVDFIWKKKTWAGRKKSGYFLVLFFISGQR